MYSPSLSICGAGKSLNKISSILLYHHLGLGDHIICNGLVREYCKNYDRVAIFSKPHNYASVSFMYRDLPNLTVTQGDDEFAKKCIFLNKFKLSKYKYEFIKLIGHKFLKKDFNSSFDKEFYEIAGVDFKKKWDNFHVTRDFASEQAPPNRLHISS